MRLHYWKKTFFTLLDMFRYSSASVVYTPF